MTTESYVEILREHGEKVKIFKEIKSNAYMGECVIREEKGSLNFDDGSHYLFNIKDAKVFKGIWEIDLTNVNPEILTNKGIAAKQRGTNLVYTFEMAPVEYPEDEFGPSSIHYELQTNQDYNGYFTGDLICSAEEILREWVLSRAA